MQFNSIGSAVILGWFLLNRALLSASAAGDPPLDLRRSAAVERVESGRSAVASAAWWGFDPADSTAALQAAINSKAKRVIVPFMGRPWIIRPVTLRSDLELVFEPGVLVWAKKGEFRGPGDSLFSAVDCANVEVRGYGATLRMRKHDYEHPPYAKAEWRMGLSFTGCRHVRVEGLRIEQTGGDGVYIGSSARHPGCSDLVVRDCVCADNYRQGISVISAVHLLIENCRLCRTEGTAPEAGIDLEPDTAHDRLVDCVIRNCRFEDNDGNAILIYLKQLTHESEPVSIRFENCLARLGRAGMTPDEVAARNPKGWSGIAIGRVRDNGPQGSIEFVRCATENTGREGLRVYDKSADGVRLRFRDCVWSDAWVARHREYGGPRAPILIESRDAAFCSKPGGIQFIDCFVHDAIRGAPIRFEDETGRLSLQAVSGAVHVQDPEATSPMLGPRPVDLKVKIDQP
jgi:Right handed beta helix region